MRLLDPAILQKALEEHPCRRLPVKNLRPAAVLLPLFLNGGADHVLLTRRAVHLRHHQGEVAFPGGSRQADDPDLLSTALRETEEEVGIRPADVKVLGRLDDTLSVHGYHVTPFVGVFPGPYPLRPDGGEIAEILQIPLARFLDPAVFREEDWRHRGRSHPVCFYRVDGHEVWGMTAAILRQFLSRAGLQPPEALHSRTKNVQ